MVGIAFEPVGGNKNKTEDKCDYSKAIFYKYNAAKKQPEFFNYLHNLL
jgi:hypothetical protein